MSRHVSCSGSSDCSAGVFCSSQHNVLCSVVFNVLSSAFTGDIERTHSLILLHVEIQQYSSNYGLKEIINFSSVIATCLRVSVSVSLSVCMCVTLSQRVCICVYVCVYVCDIESAYLCLYLYLHLCMCVCV